MSKEKFLAPQTCEACDSAPQGRHCFTRFNCLLYAGTVDLNIDRVAETASEYNPQSEWERDVEELRALIEKGA